MSQANPGSITKGVLLNVSINLFISFLWLPLCGMGASYGNNNPQTSVALVSLIGMASIGLSQIIHVLPLIIYFQKQHQPQTIKGIFYASGVTLLVWAIAWGVFVLLA